MLDRNRCKPEGVVEYFCQTYADHVITNMNITKQENLDWDADVLLRKVQSSPPVMRMTIFAVLVILFWHNYQALVPASLEWQLAGVLGGVICPVVAFVRGSYGPHRTNYEYAYEEQTYYQ